MVIHLVSDLDPDEAQEWLDSVGALVAAYGTHCARELLRLFLPRELRADATNDAASGYGIDTRCLTSLIGNAAARLEHHTTQVR
jgi:hypothetical protein